MISKDENGCLEVAEMKMEKLEFERCINLRNKIKWLSSWYLQRSIHITTFSSIIKFYYLYIFSKPGSYDPLGLIKKKPPEEPATEKPSAEPEAKEE